jgi:hypothetical protein
MKIWIYAPDAKERFETARQHSILHPERIVGNPEVIPRNVGEELALLPHSNSVKTFVMARAAPVPGSGKRLEICQFGWLRGPDLNGRGVSGADQVLRDRLLGAQAARCGSPCFQLLRRCFRAVLPYEFFLLFPSCTKMQQCQNWASVT